MPINAGKQIGRLNLRVIPDVSQFKSDLREKIKEIQKEFKITLNVDGDLTKVRDDVRKFREEANREGIDLNVKVTTALAKSQLALLTRDRVVNITAKIKQSTLKDVETFFGMISGGRLANQVFGDIAESLSKIDLNVPKISRVALGFATLASSALSAGSAIITTGGDLLVMAQTALAVPAIVGALGAGVVTLIVALKDAQTQLASLGPGFSSIGAAIKENFWAQARQPVIDYVTTVLPALKSGFADTATSLGKQAKALADGMAKAFTPKVLTDLFGQLTKSMDVLTPHIGDLVDAVKILGQTGAQFLPRLTSWVGGLFTSFDGWLKAKSATGELTQFIEDGIKQLKNLASIAGSVAGVLYGLNTAAQNAGADGLTSLAGVLKSLNDIVNGSTFQTALTTLFSGAASAMKSIGGGLSTFLGGIADDAPQIGTALTLAGQAVGELVDAIGKAIQSPAFKAGLTGLFTGIKAGVDGLLPAVQPVIDLLGQLGTTVGQMAGPFGTLLGTIKTVFAPVLDGILKSLTPLVPMIGKNLTGAISSLQPVATWLGDWLTDHAAVVQTFALMMGGLAAAIKLVQFGTMTAQLIRHTAALVADKVETLAIIGLYAKDFVVAMAKGTAALVAQIAMWIAQKAALIASKVAVVASTIAQYALNLAMSLNPIGIIIIAITALVAALVWFFTQTDVGRKAWQTFMDWLSGAWTATVQLAQTVWGWLTGFFSGLWSTISTDAVNGWNTVIGFFTGLWPNYIQPAIQALIDGAVNLFLNWTVYGLIISHWTEITQFFSGLWPNFIQPAIQAVIDGAVNLFLNWTVFGIIISHWGQIVSFFAGLWGQITGSIAAIINGIVAYFSGLKAKVLGTLTGAATWLISTGSSLLSGMLSGLRSMWGSVASYLSSLPSAISGVFSDAGTWLLEAGKSIVQGLIDGINGMVDKAKSAASGLMSKIANFFPHSPAKEGPFSGHGWTLYSGQALAEGFADGIAGRVKNVRDSAASMMQAASGSARFDVSSADSAAAASAALTGGTNITVEGNVGYDPQQIADEMAIKKKQAALLANLSAAVIK